MIGIYKITNKLNGKSYVGQSTCIKRRWENHKCLNNAKYPSGQNYNYPLYRSMRKYGVESFKFTILERCDIGELAERELYYIKKYNTYKNGYNQTMNTINPFLDEEILERAIKNMKANHSTEEHKAKQAEITKKLWENEEYRQNVIIGINGKSSIERISNNAKKMWENPTIRQKLTNSAKERSNTEEFKKRKSDEIKQAWQEGKYDKIKMGGNFKKHIQRMNNDKDYKKEMSQKFSANRPNSIAIEMIDKTTDEVIKGFDKLMDGAKWIRENTNYLKADYSTINKVCKGRGNTAYGYKWRYKQS